MRAGVRLFTRDITIGGNAFTEEIQKQLGVAADEAEAYKVGGTYDEHGVVPQEVERDHGGRRRGHGRRVPALARLLPRDHRRHQRDRASASPAAARRSPSLHRAIERRSRLPLEVADAWNRVEVDPTLDRSYLAAHSPEALVGLGLALRASGDK